MRCSSFCRGLLLVIGRTGECKDLLFKVAHSCSSHVFDSNKFALKRTKFAFHQRTKFAHQKIRRTAVIPMRLKELSLRIKELSIRLKMPSLHF
jgi:hypothetical protein